MSWSSRIQALQPHRLLPTHNQVGRICNIIGSLIEVEGLNGAIGQRVWIRLQHGEGQNMGGEVVGFREGKLLIMPYEWTTGIQAGDFVTLDKENSLQLSESLKGEVLDAFGIPLSKKRIGGERWSPKPESLLEKPLIKTPIWTGIRVIDGFLTIGEGQRIGIMSGSGVGKSTLLGMLARSLPSDVNVIALIGERRREVGHFIEKNLGEEGLKKSVVIVTTGDQSALLRLRAAFTACHIASYFREKGAKVLFMMDSVTRVAMASREIGLTAGEPPTSKGYPPSTFALLPKIFEQAGLSEGRGSITGIYTVLVEGDDFLDPICDAVRGIVDGHINLSRSLAVSAHFPAIDILTSLSRVMDEIVSPEHLKLASEIRRYLSLYEDYRDLIELGLYKKDSHPDVERAIRIRQSVQKWTRQQQDDLWTPIENTLSAMERILRESAYEQN